MTTDMDMWTVSADRHPDENQLLLALERELSVDEAAQIDRHLGNCWSCRARSDELRRGILAFVEYREKRYLPSLPAAPHDYRNFPQRLREVAREEGSREALQPLWAWLYRGFSLPSRFKWASLVASTTAAVFFWVQVIAVPSSLTAAEILVRATAAEGQTAGERTIPAGMPRKVHQKVRIRSTGVDVIRDFEWSAGTSTPQPQWGSTADAAKWNVPLTASAFAAWRDSVPGETDQIKRWGDRLTLVTRAGNSAIAEAQLIVRYTDFHPIEQHIHFAAGGDLDIEEVAFEVVEENVPAPPRAVSAQTSTKNAPTPAEVPPTPAIDLNEAEFQIRLLMFERQWDLEEDVTIVRSQDRIVVSGTASSPERAAEMESVLGKVPDAQISVAAPQGNATAPAAGPSERKSTPASSTPAAPLLKDILETTFAREERLEFIDRCLDTSDLAMSHAWALRKLGERYTPAEENQLTAQSRTRLHEMVRAHVEKVAQARLALKPLLDLLPDSRTRRLDPATNWIAAAGSLFQAVQDQDSLVAALVVGTQNAGQKQSAFERFRLAYSDIGLLLDELKKLVP